MTSDAAVEKLIDALNRLDLSYMVVGSFSSNAYGIERSTRDADFVLQADSPIEKLREAITPTGWVMNPQVGFETKLMTTKYEFDFPDTGFKAEFFLLSDDPHDQERFQRRVKYVLQEKTAYLPTAEDVVIQKLRWARHKDLQDVRDILDVQGDRLDFDYIHHWCGLHGSLETLREVQAMPFE